MMFLLRPVRYLAKALVAQESSRQLAAGLALGVMVGLVPKGNLTAVVLAMVLFALRVNLGTGLLSAFVVSLAAPWLDPLSHAIGYALLTFGPLEPVWARLYDLPLVPWTAFNNTVVLGSFVLGAALAYPVYRASEPIFARYQPTIAARLLRFRPVQVLLGIQLAGHLRRS